MKKYYRIMPGGKSMHLEECLNRGFIGVDFNLNDDLKDIDDDDLFDDKDELEDDF